MTFNLVSWLRSQSANPDLDVTCADISNLSADDRREWLIGNGLGSYASASITTANTRRYHGLLVAALDPPVARTLLLSRIDEFVNGENLSTNQWTSRVVSPEGYKRLVAFTITPVPTWVFAVAGGYLIKQVAMLPGKQEVAVGYSWVGDAAVDLALSVIVSARDFHGETAASSGLSFNQTVSGSLLKIGSSAYQQPLFLHFDAGSYQQFGNWYCGYYFAREFERGLRPSEDCYHAGSINLKLKPGQSVVVRAGLSDKLASGTIGDTVKAVVAHQADLLSKAGNPGNADVRQLVLGADTFVVHRQSTDSSSVIAGYHWFNDWGRDSMISLPGLALAAGRPDVAKGILSTFRRYLSQGMLPNNFPDRGQQPEYNTADATLLWAWAMDLYYRRTGDIEFVKQCLPDMTSVVDWHLQGTRYNIHMDAADGLIAGGAPNVPLTWMDAKCGDLVVTPRRGKPVEISALWYNYLLTLAQLHEAAGLDGGRFRKLATTVRQGFLQFWNADKGCLFDLINEDGSKDASVRPNQLFAISLPHSLLTDEQAQSVLWVVESELLTPMGLRSLSPYDLAYTGLYGGDRASADQYHRDLTYHQGTVWAWLIGIWVDARMRVYGKTAENIAYVKSRLAPLRKHIMAEAGLGSISEIFDGNPPHKAQGCVDQAWSVAELLRVLTAYPELQ